MKYVLILGVVLACGLYGCASSDIIVKDGVATFPNGHAEYCIKHMDDKQNCKQKQIWGLNTER